MDNNYTPCNVWDVITYSFLNFNGSYIITTAKQINALAACVFLLHPPPPAPTPTPTPQNNLESYLELSWLFQNIYIYVSISCVNNLGWILTLSIANAYFNALEQAWFRFWSIRIVVVSDYSYLWTYYSVMVIYSCNRSFFKFIEYMCYCRFGDFLSSKICIFHYFISRNMH